MPTSEMQKARNCLPSINELFPFLNEAERKERAANEPRQFPPTENPNQSPQPPPQQHSYTCDPAHSPRPISYPNQSSPMYSQKSAPESVQQQGYYKSYGHPLSPTAGSPVSSGSYSPNNQCQHTNLYPPEHIAPVNSPAYQHGQLGPLQPQIQNIQISINDANSNLQTLNFLTNNFQNIIDHNGDIKSIPDEMLDDCLLKIHNLAQIYTSWAKARETAIQNSNYLTPSSTPTASHAPQYPTMPAQISVPVHMNHSSQFAEPSRIQQLNKKKNVLRAKGSVSPVQPMAEISAFQREVMIKKANKAKKGKPSIANSESSKEKRTNECAHCGSNETPEWRRGPDGERSLCNACGLFFAKLSKKYDEEAASRIMRDRRSTGLQLDRRISLP
ncbi:unnamed protein product [[Candida] boidinii]|nr:transcription factor activity, sequence-specific DNA binding protein [[Candida] boidinii]GME86628.1 unnamed protein product [[Candida] boidinii]